MKKNILLLFFLLSLIGLSGKSFAQTLLMNEIYSRGVAGTAGDWIEVYNPTAASIDLTGYKIYDSGGQGGTKPKKEFPAGTILPAKGFYVIVVDTTITGDLSGFGLSSGGEKVWLENPTGTIIDTVTFVSMTETQSYSRIPDGKSWGLTPITRGFSNVVVVMNEIFSRGTVTEPDWIELYNAANESVDLSGYKIYDNGGQGGTKPKKVIASGTSIPAKGFLVVVVDNGDSSGFGLSSSGETVWLENGAGVIIDTIAFPALTATQSYGRVPDGKTWKILDIITKGVTNGTIGITKDVIVNRDFALEQNYPNPFNPSTVIRFTTFTKGHVTLSVFNQIGEQVAVLINEEMGSGSHAVAFNAASLTSGVYYYRLNAGSASAVRKMIFLK